MATVHIGDINIYIIYDFMMSAEIQKRATIKGIKNVCSCLLSVVARRRHREKNEKHQECCSSVFYAKMNIEITRIVYTTMYQKFYSTIIAGWS